MIATETIDVVHIESGIDYITMTMSSDEMYSSQWWDDCMVLLETEQQNGNAVKQSAVLGYNGALVGQVFVGSREDGTICRSSGAAAARVFAALYHPFCRVSRLDLQTTIWTAERAFSIGPEAYRRATEWNRHASGAIKRKVYEMHGNDGGYTLYVGSRTSNSFLRLYDKNAQSKDERYTNAWRYEVQIQGTSAAPVAESLTRSKGTIAGTIAATVRKYCIERGVIPAYSADMEAIVVPSQEIPKTDVARMLMWLEKQVLPTVDRLRKMGYTADVAQLFGFASDAQADATAHD